MSNKLDLLSEEETEFDLISLGAMVHRLDPGIVPFRKADECDIHVSGGEFNVAANLSDCFELNTGIVTAMVNYRIGDMIHERIRAMGVTPFYKRYDRDGVRGPNMATVYSDRGQGVRGPRVSYNRADEAAAKLEPGDIDWDEIFSHGVRWFHSGGIFSALSETTSEVIIEGMKKAKEAGAMVSYDLNYRAKLWDSRGGQEECIETNKEVVQNVDVLVGNEEDLQQGLGIPGPDVKKESDLDPNAFYDMIEKVTSEYSNIKALATTLREVESTNRHNWSAVAWHEGETYQAPTCEIDVYDRVGGGDGFASGFIYGLLNDETLEDAVRLGWAHGAMIPTTPGDTTMVSLDQVKSFAGEGSARIKR